MNATPGRTDSRSNGSPAGSTPTVSDPEFDDETARRLWENYVGRIEAKLEPLRPSARREIVQELKTHLLDSIRHDEADQASVRVLNATEKLGRPEEYLEPIVTDRIIEEGASTYNPIWVLKGLGRTLTRGVKKTALGLLFGTGYLLAASFVAVALLKPFYPDHVGLFYEPGRRMETFAFGFLEQTDGMVEVLSYWVMPLGLVLGLALYGGLTKMLVFLRSSD
jgi:hypothetical protein